MNLQNERRPGTFRVQRIRRIQASPERIYALIGDLVRTEARFEIVEAAAPRRLKITLADRNTAELRLTPEGDTTLLAWTFFGPRAFLTRVLHILCQVDRMLGRALEGA